MRVLSPVRPSDRAGEPVRQAERLIDDLGLAAHPAVLGPWAELRGAWDTAGDLRGLQPRLRLLGASLLRLRPARTADIAAVWAQAGVPLRGSRVVPLRVVVDVAGADGLAAHVGGAAQPLAAVGGPGCLLAAALRRHAAQRSEVDGLVVVVDCSGLSGEALDAADAVPWEAIVHAGPPVAAHVVRTVAPSQPARPHGPVSTVGFVTAATGTAAREQAWLEAAWGLRVEGGRTSADLVHVHAHGRSGALSHLDARTLSAPTLVLNACEGAHAGGAAREAVVSGRARDAFGFTERVLASTTTTLTSVFHATLCEWSDAVPEGLLHAGRAGRAAMGGQPAAESWRHYRAVSSAAVLSDLLFA